MYNLPLPMLMCYVLKLYALRLPTCSSAVLGSTDYTDYHVCLSHTVLCGALYTACVDTSRMVFWDRSQSAEADTSLEASKSSGPTTVLLRQRNMLLKWLQHLQKKMIHRIQNLYKLSSLGDL